MITLKTLNKATAQEVFEQAATHLLTQKKKSLDGIVRCMYKSADGLKCAAGCFIADDEYDPSFETKTWVGLVKNAAVPGTHSELIKQLQIIHDTTFVEDWKEELKLLSEKFEGLSNDFLNKL
jgi:hypothetical protein